MAKQFNDQNFEKEVIESSKEKPVLVDFYADWCGPCKMQGPIVDKLSEEMENKAIIGKLNVDEAQETASKYEVMSIPTLIIFKDGEAKETLTGMRDQDSLKESLEKYF